MWVVESYTKLRAATTATAFLWAKMKTACRTLLSSAAVRAAFAEMSAGSQKQYGFLIPAESGNCDTVEIYEAPIDAMSGATLRQYKHDSPWRSVHYLALGGLNHQPIDYFLQQHPEVKRVSLCFDRDAPGRNFTKIVAKRLAERGYIVQDAPPAIGKDYNDYLLAARRLISMER